MKSYILHKTKKFRQDIRRAKKRSLDLQRLYIVLQHIQNGLPLASHYHNHRLWMSEYKNSFECHIYPDFLLIYRYSGDNLHLIRCGSHADLF